MLWLRTWTSSFLGARIIQFIKLDGAGGGLECKYGYMWLIKGVRVDPCSVRSSGRFSVPSAARLFPDPRSSWNSANLLTSGSWLFLRRMFSVRKKTWIWLKRGDLDHILKHPIHCLKDIMMAHASHAK